MECFSRARASAASCFCPALSGEPPSDKTMSRPAGAASTTGARCARRSAAHTYGTFQRVTCESICDVHLSKSVALTPGFALAQRFEHMHILDTNLSGYNCDVGVRGMSMETTEHIWRIRQALTALSGCSWKGSRLSRMLPVNRTGTCVQHRQPS